MRNAGHATLARWGASAGHATRARWGAGGAAGTDVGRTGH